MRIVVINHVTLDGLCRRRAARMKMSAAGLRMVDGPWPGMILLFSRRWVSGCQARWWIAVWPAHLPGSAYCMECEGWAVQGCAEQYSEVRGFGQREHSLDWPNSALVTGDVPEEVSKLKQAPGGNLVIMEVGG